MKSGTRVHNYSDAYKGIEVRGEYKMKARVEGYENYGVLGYEKQPFYTINAPSPLAVASKKILFILPEGWKTAKNEAGEALIESPDGNIWIAERLLYNRQKNSGRPTLNIKGFKYYLEIEEVEEACSEIENKENKPCQIIGIQFPLEEGIPSKDIIQSMSIINCDGYDFHRIDGDTSSAYFIFNSDIYMEFQERGLLSYFETWIKMILNDVNLESESCNYEFEGYDFWFGYSLTNNN